MRVPLFGKVTFLWDGLLISSQGTLQMGGVGGDGVERLHWIGVDPLPDREHPSWMT